MLETGKVRVMPARVSAEMLKADLENYKQKVLQLGASQVEIIPACWVQIDERVRLKCMVPPCPDYGRCGNCPPHTPEPDFMRKALSRFKWAVLFKHDVIAVEDFADITRYFPHGQKQQRKTGEIAAQIESLAFADGYQLAVGFGAGGCRDTLCSGGLCKMLDSGRCLHILRSRPSMEGVGIDVCDLVAKVNWKIYPIYRSVDPDLVPCAISVGIVFIH